jgi:mono/diheme cytochrome c family protein
MPSYSWMFSGGAESPSGEASDVVAFLQSLGRAAEPTIKDEPVNLTISVGRVTREGRDVFVANCSGCHGLNGDADSPGGRALRPPALNLTGFEMTDAIVTGALSHGVRGSSMPAWSELTSEQLNAVASYAVSLQSDDALPEAKMFASQEILHEAGQRVYETHCSRCHGDSGLSDGRMRPSVIPCLPNLWTCGRPSQRQRR